jgi:hypothetical protein
LSKHIVFGVVVGAAVFLLLLQFVPEARCADGWASPSIGRQGACSHHGGVRGSGIWLLLAAAVGVGAGIAVARRLAPSAGDRAAAEASVMLEVSGREADRAVVDLIVAAMRADRRISFVYTKRGSTISEKRTIIPRGFQCIARPSTGGTTLCVVGFCEMRRAERTFAVELMKRVQAVDGVNSFV